MLNDIENRFTYHKPKAGQPELYEQIRKVALEYANFLVIAVPPSRELSLALTKLEECVMHANAGIARNS